MAFVSTKKDVKILQRWNLLTVHTMLLRRRRASKFVNMLMSAIASVMTAKYLKPIWIFFQYYSQVRPDTFPNILNCPYNYNDITHIFALIKRQDRHIGYQILSKWA